MKAADIMAPTVITVSSEATIQEAIRLMLQNRISGLPVVNAVGDLVGIVTEGDFLRRAEIGTGRKRSRWLELLAGPGKLADEYVQTHSRRVKDIMTADVISVELHTPLDECVQIMQKHNIKRVPVVEERRVLGMITRATLVHVLGGVLKKVGPANAEDNAIRRRILAELNSLPWKINPGINVIVQDGIVDLRGVITEDRERNALRVAAENVRGVKAVKDHLTWVEPISGFVIEPPAEGNNR
jgi:CBS domain-containing protein